MNLLNTGDKLFVDAVEAVTESVNGIREVAGITDGTDIVLTEDLLKVEGALIKDKDNNTMNSGRVVNIYFEKDTTIRTIGTSWVTGKTWQTRSKTPGNDIIIHWRIPSRGWIDGWSGIYHEIEYSVDNSATWVSLGNTGYDGGIMYTGAQVIGSQAGTIFINITEVRESNNIRFRFRHIQYGAQATSPSINDTHSITTGALGWAWTSLTTQEIGV